MKFSKLLACAAVLGSLLVGCSGKTETVGALPNIKLTGYAMGQRLVNAEVIFVGIDANGQPQRLNDDYVGDRNYTNEQGYFEGFFNGAYTGPLLVVVRKHSNADQVTTLRCALVNGCTDSDSNAVAFGDAYAVPSDFEIWGLVHETRQGMTVEVSWLTHIAAKLAYASYVSNGTCDANGCDGVTPVSGIITGQSAFKANDHVKNLFGMSASAVQTTAWYPGAEQVSSDSVQATQQAIHGLLAQQLEQVAKDNNENLSAALTRISDEFLSNVGQFAQARTAVTDLSLKYFLDSAVTQGQALQSSGQDIAEVGQAIGLFETNAASLVVDALTSVSGADLIEGLNQQITEARNFIQNVQTWVADLGSQTSTAPQYASYFGQDMAEELARVDDQWQAFKGDMVDELETFYQTQLEFVEYGLSCVRNGLDNDACDGSHSLAASAVYTPSTNTLRYVQNGFELVATISTLSSSSTTEGDYFYQLSYTSDLTQESSNALLESGLVVDQRAYIQVGLNEPLTVGQTPIVAAIGMYFPELTLKEKDGTGGFKSLRFEGENVVIETVGTKDVTVDNGPTHYNLLSVNLPGYLTEGSLDDADKIEMNLIVNSDPSSASLYYPEQKFPSLDVRLDIAAFQQFAALGAVNFETSDFAGWLQRRTDIPDGELRAGEVSFFIESNYENIESSLKTRLDLSDTATNFELGGFQYSGGQTAVALWEDSSVTASGKLATQCIKSKGLWSCSIQTGVQNLGCEANETLGDSSASMIEVFDYLRDQGCIPEVVIEGRGTYTIDYTNGTAVVVPFVNGAMYDAQLARLMMLGVDSASLRLLTRFNDADGNQHPIANVSVLAQVLDENNVTFGASITQGYQGASAQDLVGIDWIVPYGENTLWMAVGTGSNDDETQEAMAFYIQDGSVTLSLKGFDELDNHTGDIGFIRYAGSLIGSVRKEGGVYVVRYVDNSWQLL